MSQFLAEDPGRFLPILSPSGRFGPSQTRDLDDADILKQGAQDVVELGRDFQDVIDVELTEDDRNDSQGRPRSFTPPTFVGAPNNTFNIERDVVINIYAANQASGGPPNPGGNLDLVA